MGPGPGLTTHRDQKRGYEVTFPSRWHRARENLTRLALVDPREILTLATFPLALRRGDRCYPSPWDAPVPALGRLGPRDALISIQERIEIEHRVPDDRPRPFRFPRWASTPGERNCPRHALGRASFVGFVDQGRQFYAFVALGRRAPSRTRTAVRRVLDSLVFEHRSQAPRSRLRFAPKPYLGVSCRRPNRFACDRVGLTVWLAEPAEQVVATIGGRQLSLSDRWRGRRFEGFLRPAGLLNGPLRVTPRPGSRRWLGDPPVYAYVRISATYADGTTATRTVRVPLHPGYG